MKKLYLLATCFLLAAAPAKQAWADMESTPLASDARIRVVPYDVNEVFKFVGHYGYQSSIEFAPDEVIKTISVGDSVAWQIVPDANRIFIKPIEENPQTNMTVVTNKRTYQFELYGKHASSVKDNDMIFVMRFTYPGETDVSFLDKSKVPEVNQDPSRYNQNYTISGPDRISPIRIFDDGEFTYFQFKDINADIPAFFKVDSDGKEAIINFRTVGDYIVVERVTSMFTLRHGSDVVCVYNEAMPLEMHKDTEKKKSGNNSSGVSVQKDYNFNSKK